MSSATLIEQNLIDIRDTTKLKLRSVLTAAIHQQAIRRPNLAAIAEAEGTNLQLCGTRNSKMLAEHAVKLCESMWLPVRVVAGLYVFYTQVGGAIAAGIFALMVYFPARTIIMNKLATIDKELEAATSSRTSRLTQLIENIVPLRMLGWEQHLVQQIQSIREGAELKMAISQSTMEQLLWAMRIVCSESGPVISLFIYSMVADRLTSDGNGESSGIGNLNAEHVNIKQLLIVGTDNLEISEKRTVGEPNSKFVVEVSSGVFKWQAAPASADSDTDTGDGSRGTVRVNF
ncbi:hypothetical protein FBU59_001849, partial [Linderina macrospora]